MKEGFSPKHKTTTTEEQTTAIYAPIDKPLSIVSCPGSGKTYVLIERIEHLFKTFQDQKLLVLTFSNMACWELSNRLEKKKISSDFVHVNTFHSFGLRILRQFAHVINRSGFRLISEDEQKELIMKIDNSNGFDISKALRIIERYKIMKILPVEWELFYRKYENKLKEQNCVDMCDLIKIPVEILTENPKVLELFQRMYVYCLVDEMQDVSNDQLELIRLIFSKSGRITVVGDDDQSIYGFRGANPDSLMKFDQFFPNPSVLYMTMCFRSEYHIVKAMNSVINHNKKRFMKTITSFEQTPPHKKVRVICADSIKDMIETISKTFNRYNTNAVLNRFHKDIDVMKKCFKEMNIQVAQNVSLLVIENKEAKRVISALYYINNIANINYCLDGNDRKSLDSLIERGINQISLSKKINMIASSLNLDTLAVSILKHEASLQNGNESIDAFVKSVENIKYDQWSEGLKLITCHQSKGLEFDCVCIPFISKWIKSSNSIEEERRLFYVAMSRAKSELVLFYLKNDKKPPFIQEIDQSVVNDNRIRDQMMLAENSQRPNETPKLNQKLCLLHLPKRSSSFSLP